MQNNIYQNVVLLVYGFKLYQGDLLSSKFTLINIGIKNFNHHMLEIPLSKFNHHLKFIKISLCWLSANKILLNFDLNIQIDYYSINSFFSFFAYRF